ncbi:diacylglycerol kinase catalytic domain-containing protein, partial [Streptococcus pneumoniae]
KALDATHFAEEASREQYDAVVVFGGDSDTLAAITCSIAEAAYGIPDWIKDKAYSYLDEPLKDVVRRWENRIKAY